MPKTNPIYDGSDSGPIDLATARQLVQNYRNANPPGSIQSHYFGRNTIDRILGQPGCTGIRLFHAQNVNGEREMIILGVDKSGASMLPTNQNGTNILADFSFPCPPICPPEGDL